MPQSSRTIGNFEYLGILDKPEAGVTYKVRNRTTGEFEALRTLPGASHGDPESLERFQREIRIHTRLSHPNIVAFHDALELDGQVVMTTEFVEGTALADLCQRGPLPMDQAIRAACDVLSGLEEAHALGIVHRGITAEHVIVTHNGKVKLGGFGLAKPAADTNLTRIGATVGNVRYMSPEQVTGVVALGAGADIYSVGVLLFYTLTGRLPFDGANDFDIMLAQVSAPVPQPASLNSGIAPELERIVLTALAKKPEERFPSAAAFRSALAALSGAVTGTVESADPSRETTLPQILAAEAPGELNRTLYVSGILCVVIAVIVVFLVAVH
jgi:serine/threonine protein kinase